MSPDELHTFVTFWLRPLKSVILCFKMTSSKSVELVSMNYVKVSDVITSNFSIYKTDSIKATFELVERVGCGSHPVITLIQFQLNVSIGLGYILLTDRHS